MVKRVVVDVDAGTDDAVALLLLLTQERDTKYKVVGITCTHGNTTVDNVCRNVLITLESINRSDVPVFRGAERALNSVHDSQSAGVKYFHGKDGFGDKILPSPTTNICSENAIPALNRLARGGISLICLGPLTNIALALRTYPEFSKNIKEVYIMGGSVTGLGNASPSAEFNFFSDPEAAHIVLSTLDCPISILPWESCITDNMTVIPSANFVPNFSETSSLVIQTKAIHSLCALGLVTGCKEGKSPCCRSSYVQEERFNIDGALPHMGLLNTIERDLYTAEPFWNPCDAFLVAAFLQEEYVKRYRKLHLEIDAYTRGRLVVNNQKPPNARVIEETDLSIFKNLITEMASFTPPLPHLQ